MKVVVIGGGASGMMAAIVAAKRGHDVTLLEHKDKVGRKLLATGNGRCNLSNIKTGTSPEDIYECAGKEFVKSIFNKFSYIDTIKIFEELGLEYRFRENLVYPLSDQASSVLNALRFELRDLGVKVLCDIDINSIQPKDGEFIIQGVNFKCKADKVILATGSKAQPNLGSDGSGYEISKRLGHKITPVTPGLVSFICQGDYFKELAGVRVQANISLYDSVFDSHNEHFPKSEKFVYSESGELQLTNYGVSGIAVMNISNRMNQIKGQAFLKIDFMENMGIEDLKNMIFDRVKKFATREAGELLNGVFPKKLGDVLLKISGISQKETICDVPSNKWEQLLLNIKEWNVKIKGTNNFDSAQICLGGVRIDEIKDTMESRIVPGLYFAGEIIDLHGDCGGFNLQLAWTTGAVAGMLL